MKCLSCLVNSNRASKLTNLFSIIVFCEKCTLYMLFNQSKSDSCECINLLVTLIADPGITLLICFTKGYKHAKANKI